MSRLAREGISAPDGFRKELHVARVKGMKVSHHCSSTSDAYVHGSCPTLQRRRGEARRAKCGEKSDETDNPAPATKSKCPPGTWAKWWRRKASAIYLSSRLHGRWRRWPRRTLDLIYTESCRGGLSRPAADQPLRPPPPRRPLPARPGIQQRLERGIFQPQSRPS